jgi:hypothetical protein
LELVWLCWFSWWLLSSSSWLLVVDECVSREMLAPCYDVGEI